MLKLVLVVTLVSTIALPNASAQYQQQSEDTPANRRQQTAVYHESALRRFEIVTFVSLPFTAIHSFLAVRGIQMIRQGEFVAELSGTDFKIVGASAASLALFIGFWDWLHTHDKDPSGQVIPNPPRTPSREVGQSDWLLDDSPTLVVPLVHLRF